ncbi:heavy-metal-associated domain-containing protein [Cognatishimia activa]|uniref:HMA domain-containing protein n=1 Tax=Cognatishimia activa TaxID=1715691 RepID=A0A0P1J9M1_9RHOB|nr:heavy metal-associated domain-containing protein [Cognatishimia activa]CUI62154.1 hypothetical protein TA5113_00959 [Cognatishimia activa]CUK26322.1 hypothetical protein TA5114_02131 [Cognatishimia activa]
MASDTLTLNVQGITSACCAPRVEKALSAWPDTDRVHVNVAQAKALSEATL